jgi:hypothetical protein
LASNVPSKDHPARTREGERYAVDVIAPPEIVPPSGVSVPPVWLNVPLR